MGNSNAKQINWESVLLLKHCRITALKMLICTKKQLLTALTVSAFTLKN